MFGCTETSELGQIQRRCCPWCRLEQVRDSASVGDAGELAGIDVQTEAEIDRHIDDLQTKATVVVIARRLHEQIEVRDEILDLDAQIAAIGFLRG